MTQQTFVPLPIAPATTSPVPHLTSIHANPKRGPYGSNRYRGNCGGYLIRDLIQYYQPNHVLDPMRGSGTCQDVCRELRVTCTSMDIKEGDDAADPHCYAGFGNVDFVWMHPPYWSMIRYNEDPDCLSNAPTLEDFLGRMDAVLHNCRSVLTSNGKIAVLIGGFSIRGRYQPLAQLIMSRAIDQGLWPATTEIIRFQHGNTSSRRSYNRCFIPGVHDTCMVFEEG
ncbi:hypothetical protein [Roseiconus lacunae]|uniref:hypothetical protein n=1 Tax=Roseiconus lacunae TaxID=2605694 RepID=UPI001E2BBE53|nr:hypothetical protein [Roseiconus lacunae]MCD0462387.1 hypothetical protein [Roseiconus lacunae]